MSSLPTTDQIRNLKSAVRARHLGIYRDVVLLAESVETLREALQDFMSYYDPKGGVSDVPSGPFERAEEVLG